MLTTLLPPVACAACRLCCNFLPESRWELPALESDCAERLRAQGIALAERPEGGKTIALENAPECRGKAANCPLLDCSSGCRLPRAERPLECRLWPLRLMRNEAGEVFITCYNSCPGLLHVPHETLLAHACSLLPILQQRAASFPASIRPLHAQYTILFALHSPPALPAEKQDL